MRIEEVTRRLRFVHTDHVNWVIYDGPDGVVLVDSGYLGQRAELEESLAALGRRPSEVTAVLITHAHADHLGGASWLTERYGVPVHAASEELPNLHRERLEQVGRADVLRNAWRPGVVAWAGAIMPLLEGSARAGIPSATALPLRDGRVDVPGRPRAITLPGHTTGHTVFHFDDEGVVVAGDALVTGHRTSRVSGPQLLHSMFHHDASAARAVLPRLAQVDAHVLLPGHGDAWRGSIRDAVARAAAS